MEIIENLNELYGAWEQTYKESERDLWGHSASPLLEIFLRTINPTQNSLIADFGAGDGRNLIPLLRGGSRVVGVDTSRTGLNKIRERADTDGLPRPVLVHSPVESLALANDLFDAGICIDVLSQIRHPRKALEEMHRTIGKGGALFVNLFTPADCAFGEGEMIGSRSFLYRGTLFNFFEADDCRRLFQGLFTISLEEQREWTDPPHYPFRPYQHTHSAMVYLLVK